ncbi:HigA family addiction module antitoxin [Dolichospermum sp. LEGE 00246]|uniref:HigA family addiction module antitoxin n=1 Tax=Dolichospermum sp. LEGE 00246 TaxID=1828605 RepID=UPI00187ED0B1|nr:HigA family addiction module antitoxin [Dolichospermum sp. LEGE 00246]MBE9256660.1 HigA family addiction module antidote protein [Dolichospermum sp. LEGE 00246]
MTKTTRPFTPDWVSSPGDAIAEFLEERDWTQAQLAERLGYTTKHISLLINGKASLNEETALKLERVLGSTAAFWLRYEAQYRAALAKKEEESRLQGWTFWLDQLPVRELMNQGKIPKCVLIAKNKPGVVKNLLHFFGVASPEDWQKCYGSLEVSFRRTREEQSDVGAISAWLRLGEIEAEKLDCPKYSKSKFEKAVQEIRTLTVLPPTEFEPRMQQLCRESGVVLVLVPSIKGAHVSGVARWLNPHKALIQLSLYGKSNDRFWFNFFHEAAHILLHNKENIFLDEWNSRKSLKSELEQEADKWSREFLIPPEYEEELAQIRFETDVVDFAERISIHPAIVVGRLQYDHLIDYSSMNGLKGSFCFQGVE